MLRKKNNSNLAKGARCVPIGASLALLLVILSALCPVGVSGLGGEEVYAEGDGGIATFSGWLSSSVTLTMADSVSETIEPTVAGAFKNLATVAHVEVNNSDYYEVGMHASSKDMMNSAVGSDSTAKIGSITTAGNSASFNSNQWGYNLTKNGAGVTTAVPTTADTEYQPVATTATAMPGIGKQATSNNAANDYYTMNFGAKVDTSIPAGTYSSTVTLSVVASPKQVTGFDRTDTMQGMTASICREIGSELDLQSGGADKYAATDSLGNTYYTKRLKDLRDGKSYWVAKLADGNCWMTQNLALDIPAEGLTSELTALAPGKTSWKPEEATRVVANMTEEEKLNRFTIAECAGLSGDKEAACLSKNTGYSWDEGEYVITYPDGLNDGLKTHFNGGLGSYATLKLADYFTITDTNGIDISDYKIVQDVEKGWIASNDVDFTSKSSFIDTDGKTYAKISGFAIGCMNTECTKGMYDAHYLTGNYYQWLTSVAMSVKEGEGITSDGDSIKGSICASNWELPTSGPTYNNEKTSFFNLYKTYGGAAFKYGEGNSYADADKSNGSSRLDNVIKQINGVSVIMGSVILDNPMYFSRAGLVVPDSGTSGLGHINAHGHYWSSVSSSATNARYVVIGPTAVFPSYTRTRGYGYTIHCLINTAE